MQAWNCSTQKKSGSWTDSKLKKVNIHEILAILNHRTTLRRKNGEWTFSLSWVFQSFRRLNSEMFFALMKHEFQSLLCRTKVVCVKTLFYGLKFFLFFHKRCRCSPARETAPPGRSDSTEEGERFDGTGFAEERVSDPAGQDRAGQKRVGRQECRNKCSDAANWGKILEIFVEEKHSVGLCVTIAVVTLDKMTPKFRTMKRIWCHIPILRAAAGHNCFMVRFEILFHWDSWIRSRTSCVWCRTLWRRREPSCWGRRRCWRNSKRSTTAVQPVCRVRWWKISG